MPLSHCIWQLCCDPWDCFTFYWDDLKKDCQGINMTKNFLPALLETHSFRHEMCLDQIPCVAETTEWWCVMSWVRREQLPEGRVCFWKNGGTHGLWASFPHMLGPRGAWNPCVASVLACTQPWCLSHRVLMLLTERRNTSFPCHPQEWDVPFHIVISSKSFKDQNLKKNRLFWVCMYTERAFRWVQQPYMCCFLPTPMVPHAVHFDFCVSALGVVRFGFGFSASAFFVLMPHFIFHFPDPLLIYCS